MLKIALIVCLSALLIDCAQIPVKSYPSLVALPATSPWRCLGYDRSPLRLKAARTGPGLIQELWDFDMDGKPDVLTLTHEGETYPLFYIIDADGDQSADYIYIDPKSSGKCSEIVLYKDYFAPTGVTEEKEEVKRGVIV